MRLLALDTATHAASAALVDGDRVLAAGELDTSGRSADLLVLLDRLVREAGLAPRDLEAVAVGAGPGSFTGLRIGMATAKGVAFAAGCPLWAVSSLAAVAHGAWRALGEDPAAAGLLVAAMDARRGEVYAGCYRREAGALRTLGAERVLPPSALAAMIAEARRGDEPVRLAGDARGAFAAALPGEGWLDDVRAPSGLAVAELALAGARADALVEGAPSYVRPSEAEVMYPDGVPGALRRR